MVVEGYVEKTSAQVYENLSVGVWVERGIEVDTDDDGLEDSWEEYNFNNEHDLRKVNEHPLTQSK